MKKTDSQLIKREFEKRQSRQLVAIALALFAVLLCAVLYKRPGVFGVYSKSALFGAQVLCIASFTGFTSYNWRCPSCGGFLGADIHKRACKKCGARLR